MFFKIKKDDVFDMLALGDTVTDAFIKLVEAHVHCDIKTDRCEICMKFADKIPYELVEVCPAVGNSPNAAVSCARLGLKTAIMTDIGKDQYGYEALNQFKKENVDTSAVRIHDGMKTNYHYVLWYKDDRTILIKHEEYPYDGLNIPKSRWIYLSSLGANSLSFHEKIADYLEKNPEVKVAFQPGTYQMKFGTHALAKIYKRSEVSLCNVQEAERILQVQGEDIHTLISGMHKLGPKIVVITDGPKGAYASDGTSVWFMPPYPDPKPPLERTGAGDAFSSTFVAALAQGKSIEEALRWAPANSMSVVQEIGAQKGLLTLKKLMDHLANAPAEYGPKKIK